MTKLQFSVFQLNYFHLQPQLYWFFTGISDLHLSGGQKHDSKWTLILLRICCMCKLAYQLYKTIICQCCVYIFFHYPKKTCNICSILSGYLYYLHIRVSLFLFLSCIISSQSVLNPGLMFNPQGFCLNRDFISQFVLLTQVLFLVCTSDSFSASALFQNISVIIHKADN